VSDPYGLVVASVLYELCADAYEQIKRQNPELSQALLCYVMAVMTERLSFASRVIGVLQRIGLQRDGSPTYIKTACRSAVFTDAAIEDEMHRVGYVALAGDNVARLKFEPPAMIGHAVGMLQTAQGLGQPSAQRSRFAAVDSVRLDDRLLAGFQGKIEGRRHDYIPRNEPGDAECSFQFR
jgi:hypothetical protein